MLFKKKLKKKRDKELFKRKIILIEKSIYYLLIKDLSKFIL